MARARAPHALVSSLDGDESNLRLALSVVDIALQRPTTSPLQEKKVKRPNRSFPYSQTLSLAPPSHAIVGLCLIIACDRSAPARPTDVATPSLSSRPNADGTASSTAPGRIHDTPDPMAQRNRTPSSLADEVEHCLCHAGHRLQCDDVYRRWRGACTEDKTAALCEPLRRPVLEVTARVQATRNDALCAAVDSMAPLPQRYRDVRGDFDALTVLVVANEAAARTKALELEALLRKFWLAECGARLSIAFPSGDCDAGREVVTALADAGANFLEQHCLDRIHDAEAAITACERGLLDVVWCERYASELRAKCDERPGAAECPRPIGLDCSRW